jgi:ketosteroid isomerase-like protein
MNDIDITADELAVRELAARYSDAVNRGSLQDMVAVYALDGILTAFGAPDIAGHAAIETTFAKVIADHQWLFQTTHSGIVRVEGDRARCRWWLTENALRKDGGGTLFMGCYEDIAVRGVDGWRYTHRILHPVYIGRQQFPGKTFSPPQFKHGDI